MSNEQERISEEDWKQKIEESKKEQVKEEVAEEPSVQDKNTTTEVPETTQSVKNDRPKNSLGEYIKIHNGTEEEAARCLDDSIRSEEQMQAAMQDKDSFIYNLTSAIISETSSRQNAFLRDALLKITESNKHLVNSIEEMCDKVINKRPNTDGKAKELIGREAQLNIYARTYGLIKVYLPNSGFYVILRAMTMEEMQMFYSTVDLDAQEYGRMLGGFFYLLEDFYIKQKFMELLPSIIVDSNLINWSRSNVLANSISIQDYDVLLWACCVLKYKEGIEIDLICTNMECKHISNDVKVDLMKVKYYIEENIPKEARELLLSKDPIKSSKLEVYRNDTLDLTDKFQIEDKMYHLRVPTMHEYLIHGETILANMSSLVRDKMDIKNKDTQTAIILNAYKMYTPWIDAVDDLDENGKRESWTRDQKAIHTLLESSMHESTDIDEKIKQFIIKSKLTHICYTGMECPVCHKKPGMSVTDFLPMDVQSFFFFLCCRQLELVGTL